MVQPEIVEKLQTIAEHSTSTYPSIKPSDIGELKLNLPPLTEQKAIAHILGSLDDKIELNRRMNETLEAMAQALFKSWFIDFDPVLDNAVVAGNAIPEPFRQKGEVRKLKLEEQYGSLKAAAESSHFKLHHSLFPSEFILTDDMGSAFAKQGAAGRWIPSPSSPLKNVIPYNKWSYYFLFTLRIL